MKRSGRRRFAVWAAALLIVLPACSCGTSGDGSGVSTLAGGLPAGQDPDSVAATLLLRLNDYQRVGGRREGPRGTSTFTAYRDAGDVVFLRERVSGDGGAAENRFFFRDGRLFLFHGEGVTASGETVVLRLLFRDGRLAEAVKRVGETTAPAPPAEADAALAGLGEMLASARATAATSPRRADAGVEPVAPSPGGEAERRAGVLAAGDHRDYTISAGAGRVLEVTLAVTRGEARAQVRLDDVVVGRPEPGRVWSHRVTGTGSYRIRVIGSASADTTAYTLDLRLR